MCGVSLQRERYFWLFAGLPMSICMQCGVFDGRDDWIRTSDLTHPKGALYQAEPRPDGTITVYTLISLSHFPP